ncbi:invasion associated locus B family protein [Agrobacterium pusense]|uniref:invasion associated locus B family protein n=1 Tax=Agrobacterium pusense TaxID=648995 RepID=UPI00109290CF|nr:invasion associated locus B family protein [Agrobacterium pusense]TGR68146.1 invasion associated locus B family protein [bacterium M00.F.Ca.ET.194.01.1.1]TGS54248.1 invasion associated locus B family protein [bacterium M00.F.Ca.ET.179.01.1.1]TGV47064.1 invasion associated locus B family protein [bacterium M00.F.Ca.ET.168.01.1.1]
MSFRPNMPHAAVLAIAILVCFSRGEARAQESASPAMPLHEVHGSWQLACAAPEKKDPADGTDKSTAKPLCAIAQVQLEEKTRKLVVSVEFRLDEGKAPGKLSGTIVMPFGLAVTKLFSIKSANVRLQEVQVSTCLPVGCIVSFTPFVEVVSALETGKTLTVEAPDLQGRAVSFQLQPAGFSEALKRLESLY